MTRDVAFTTRTFLLRLAFVAGMVVLIAMTSSAGGPKCIAGSSYFGSSLTGTPLVWPQGSITYYTDQGHLSPLLPNASANSFVAGAFSIWTSVPTAAVMATSGGSLAEDVNGSNVTVNSDGSISMPSDIRPTATGTPVGIVYDYDGTVTDALLGAGAGGSSECFFNAVYGGTDNYGQLATYQHALIVINGQCAQESSQLSDIEYRLVRVIGNVLGLGWSQLNLNVQTGSPHPTSDDYAGFPVMHFTDEWNCVPITLCYPSPYQLSMDDVAALSRLYPVTPQNQSSFPGKQVFAASTARIHGSVYFTDTHGNPTQPMEGVNVVARWIDPSTGLPSRRYAVSAVSGFAFTGNAGNPITGLDDAIGDPFAEWGSTSSTVEGFFDLAGLEPPGGSAQYQLSVEALDPHWSAGVGPYSPGPVAPSGSVTPIAVTVTPGNDVEQEIVMNATAQPLPQAASSWTAPASLPSGGDWMSSLTGYGDVDYFLFAAQANRTLSVAVTALDESGNASEVKAQPVIGIWSASDSQGASPPAFTSSPFNEVPFGLTRLDAAVNTSGSFLIGISDVRGDGRPDYHFHAHILYADSVSPSRIPVMGAAITVQGTGFSLGLGTTIGSTNATQLSVSSSQMTLAAPPQGDSSQNITITDQISGASTTMTNALIYGAAASDTIILLSGSNPATPVGVQATNPVSVKVVASDGITPVSGATIGWSATNNVQLSVCAGASACSIATDQSGSATTWLTPTASGVSTVTVTLAPGVYSPSKSVYATLNATKSSSDIGILAPYVWISQGATVSLPVTARLLSNGSPRNNIQVNYTIVSGSGSLSAPSAQTNSNGYATVTLNLSEIASQVTVSACVAPSNAPCSLFYGNVVPLAQQNLQLVSGAGQVSTGQAFQPVIVRVTNSASPPNPVLAAPVSFLMTVLRPEGFTTGGIGGDTNSGNSGMPVILKVSQDNTNSDINGLADVVPSSGGFSAPVEVDVAVTAGLSAALDYPLQVLSNLPTGGVPSRQTGQPVKHPLEIAIDPEGEK